VIRHCLSAAALLATALVLAGCGDGMNLKPATGTITYNGKPVDGAAVSFLSEKGVVATGSTDSEGKFTISTNGKPGASVGKHKVSVSKTQSAVGGMPANPTPQDMIEMQKKAGKSSATPSKPALPVKYSTPQSTDLTADVTTDASKNVFSFDLKD